jgi:hypothetical protein
MRNHALHAAALAGVLAFAGLAAFAQDSRQDQDPHRWPRSFQEGGLTFTVYQPQLDSWDFVTLVARAVVSVERDATSQPSYGTVWFTARTAIDKEERLVTLDRINLPRASFPATPEDTAPWLAAIRKQFPDHVRVIDLDRLETALATLKARESSARSPIRNDPPRIFMSSRPAILVLVDGPPVLRRVAGTRTYRIVNTRDLLLQDDAGTRFFLAVRDRWLEAPALEGPWTLAAAGPEGGDVARRSALAAGDAWLQGLDPEIARLVDAGEAPAVFVSTEPAELIETTGEPQLEAIDGTALLWVKNTDADLFQDSDGTWYVLVSGRWFAAPSRQGPWHFMAGRSLPRDFHRIPEQHPAAEVLASVPGTPQAAEALIANQIPQTALIARGSATLNVSYDGEPVFGPIEGTRLRYALNTTVPVIRSDDGYYACSDGVWFTSPYPVGPWTVSDGVIAAVYGIPASCPIQYVTFVRAFEVAPDFVCFGYTPGYLGTCISFEGTVVWGTGWPYKPWVKGVWIGYPATYGFGVGTRWTNANGWAIGFGFGARVPCQPWWGPLATAHPAFASPTTGRLNVTNANVYTTWERAAVRRQVATPGEATAPGNAGKNDVYSSPDGTIYRRTASGWEHYEGTTWQPAEGRSALLHEREVELENERQAREHGTQRARSTWQPSPPSPEAPTYVAPRGLRGGGGGHR